MDYLVGIFIPFVVFAISKSYNKLIKVYVQISQTKRKTFDIILIIVVEVRIYRNVYGC